VIDGVEHWKNIADQVINYAEAGDPGEQGESKECYIPRDCASNPSIPMRYRKNLFYYVYHVRLEYILGALFGRLS
jgi:hypothetical protein